jgi:hypothetical protein
MNNKSTPYFAVRIAAAIVITLLSLNMAAQQGQGYPSTNTLYERTWLATDRDVYIPGDKILVSLATIDGYYLLPITFSAVAYIELYTANGTPLVQEKALLNKGKGSVQLMLPKNIETNYYYIRAYTNYQKNFGENSFMVKKIRLINPFRIITIEKKADSAKTKSIAYKYQFRNDSLYIICNDSVVKGPLTIKSAFDNVYLNKNITKINDSTLSISLRGMKNVLSASAPGDESPLLLSDSTRGISISTSTTGKIIHYSSKGTQDSISLFVASAFRADQGKFSDTYCLSSGLVTVPTEFVYLPELSTDNLYGKITIKAGAPMPKHILVNIPRSIASLRVATIKPDSSFCLEMNNQHSNTNLIFTPTDTSSAISINLQDEFYSHFATIPQKSYFPENYLGTYIQSLMVNVQLDDAFDKPSIKPTTEDNNSFYGRWDEKLDFDKFINLPSIEEYIHELLPSVYVIKRRKRKSIRISDYNARGFIGKNPLLIVDGTPFFNHGTVLYVPPMEVKTVYVLNRKLTYLSAQFDGVLDIRTRNNYSEELNQAPNTLSIDYVSPKYYTEQAALFSNTPLWQPFTTAPPSGQFSRIQNGQLIIRLQGLSDGKPFDVYSEIIK